MKTEAEDKIYVDYKAHKYGVRVWRDSCQPITLHGERWVEYDSKYTLPIDPPVIEIAINKIERITTLARNVADYEQYRPNELSEDKTELRLLLLGSLSFDSVISPL